MKHEFGTIKVEAEIREESDNKIETLSDVTTKYSELGEKQKEHLYAVFLTAGNEEIGDKLIGLGSTAQTSIDIQDLARTAVLVNAAAAILVHNHPSGKPEATQQDIEATREIHDALKLVGVELLDHAIISRNGSYSMKQHGDGPYSEVNQ